MTAQEAIEGIQVISRRFGKGYKWGELEPIWPDLLECSAQAMVRVAGILTKNCRQLPSPGYILSQVQWWDMNLAPAVEAEARAAADPGADPDAEGREALELMKLKVTGGITPAEHAERLYRMAERYGKPGYAVEAKNIQSRAGA